MNNSALRLNTGYFIVPSGVYINGDFSVSLYVKFYKFYFGERIFEFGTTADQHIVIFLVDGSNKLRFDIYHNYVNEYFSSNTIMQLNKWYYVVLTLSNKLYRIYIDGKLDISYTLSYAPADVMRTKNYFGKSRANEAPADIDLSDIKLYNRALDISEIKN